MPQTVCKVHKTLLVQQLSFLAARNRAGQAHFASCPARQSQARRRPACKECKRHEADFLDKKRAELILEAAEEWLEKSKRRPGVYLGFEL